MTDWPIDQLTCHSVHRTANAAKVVETRSWWRSSARLGVTHLRCQQQQLSNFLKLFDFRVMISASSISTCSRDDPQLERCIINAVYQLRPLLVHGNLGDGYRTPPLEPLQLDNIELGGSSQFQALFSELEATGGSNFVIDRIMWVARYASPILAHCSFAAPSQRISPTTCG